MGTRPCVTGSVVEDLPKFRSYPITQLISPIVLRWRLILGAIFIVAFMGLCWIDHSIQPRGLVLAPLAVILCGVATSETLSLVRAAGARIRGGAVYAGALLPVVVVGFMPLLTTMAHNGPAEPDPTGWATISPGIVVAPALLVGLLICMVAAIKDYDGTPQSARDLSASVFVVVYIGGSVALLAAMRLWKVETERDTGLLLLAVTILIVKSGDIGAYTIGRLFGRRKLAPRLSPGKTWEGAGGAIVFSCLAGLAALAMTARENVFSGKSVLFLAGWLGFCLALSITGMIGDLAESLLKRSASVKDSSAWMPGFGGVLDVLDSLLLAGPVSYACALLGWTGL
jgi:phosphatidate cytidylyltransferase